MVYATADGTGGNRLRVGMVGGGRNAFIGAVHRMAMRLDDKIELVAGALSSDPENAAASAAISASRPTAAMPTIATMAQAEAGAAGRHRGGRHRHAQSSACTRRHRVPGSRHRRDLRQAAVDDARRGARSSWRWRGRSGSLSSP